MSPPPSHSQWQDYPDVEHLLWRWHRVNLRQGLSYSQRDQILLWCDDYVTCPWTMKSFAMWFETEDWATAVAVTWAELMAA